MKCENIFVQFDKSQKSDMETNFAYEKIDDRFSFKIGDFGFSAKICENKLLTKQMGTPLNMAPEILNGNPYN